MSKHKTQFKQTELGPIPEGWCIYKFGDVSDFVYGKMPEKNQIVEFGYPIYTGYRTVGNYAQYMYNNPKLIIVARGVGGTGDVKISPPKCWITNLSIIANLDEQIIDTRFLKYYFYNGLKQLDSGSAQSQITINDLKNIELTLPPIDEQQKIAKVLGVLDEKIELNRQMNKTLESLGQTIFNNRFTNNHFGKIGKLSEIAEITTGKRPVIRSTDKTQEFSIPIIGAASVMGYTSVPIFQNEDIIVTGRVGTHGTLQRINEPCWPSDNTLIIRSNTQNFVYQTMLNIDFHSLNKGSTQPLITQTDLKNIEIDIPAEDEIKRYEEMVQPLTELIRSNDQQNITLSQIRDTLLPRFMSGKLRAV